MKKTFDFIVINILIIPFIFSGCSDITNSHYSTNSNDKNPFINDSEITPGENFEETFLNHHKYINNGEIKSDKYWIPITVSYNSSISHEETNVEVNKPISITFDEDIDHYTVTPNSFFLQNSDGNVLYSRIIRDYRTFTLIPRIPLQPGRTYSAVMRGIKNRMGRRIETIKISYTNRDLDFGLYWYGKNGLCEKYFPYIENAYYDDEKSTVIYAHGFEAGITSQIDDYGRKGFKRETFLFKGKNFNGAKEHNGLEIYINHSWIDSGWNTGMVFWNQFADDIDLWATEAKIWTFDNPRGARYRYLKKNNKGEYRQWDKKILFKEEMIEVNSIGDLLGIYLLDAIQFNISNNLRLVGHSLGNQVVCRLTKKCLDKNIFVERVALLDPAWTQNSKKYLGDQDGNGKDDWVGERCKQILFNAIKKHGDKFAVEIYHTTGLNLGIPVVDDNVPLTSKVCDVNLIPGYYGIAQLHPKHMVAKSHYFWSYASPPPIEYKKVMGVYVRSGIGPSASTSTEDIVKMMNEGYEWTQLEGKKTPNPSDDSFEKKKK